jgi:hypothetical protein
LLAVAVVATVPAYAAAQAIDTVRVMTYNILLGGARYGPISQTVGIINAAQADIIGVQEGFSGGSQAIATALGFFHHNFNTDIAILSRYPFVSVLSHGVVVQLSPTQQAYVFDTHLAPNPYQPYDFRNGVITTEAQAIASAQATRGAATTSLLNEMSSALASGAPVFLTGDFNEPSHLDWTQEAADAGLHFGKKVAWPASTAVTNAGLVDAFRELRPDEVNDLGYTWTPGYPAPTVSANEVHDRIDFVYYSGINVAATIAENLGYDTNDGSTDIGTKPNPYPSDHRAVVVEFALSGDFSRDNIVDAEDYVVWRKSIATQSTFNLWKATFGNTVGPAAATSSALPEPSTTWLVAALFVSVGLGGRRNRTSRTQTGYCETGAAR